MPALLLLLLLLFYQDMPGWGDDINLVNSLKTVIHFILKQRQKDYTASKAGQTGVNTAANTLALLMWYKVVSQDSCRLCSSPGV